MKNTYVETYFEQALFNLLTRKSFSEITITELCKKAGVGRTTFYRHYDGIDDIITTYLERTFSFADYSHSTKIKERLEGLFTLLYKQKEYLLLLNKHQLLTDLFAHLYKTTYKHMNILFDENNSYTINFYAGAASSFILTWIDKKMEETPESLSELFYESLKGLMVLE